MTKFITVLFLALAVVQCAKKTSSEPPKKDGIIITEQSSTDSIKGSRRAYAEKHLGGSTSVTINYTSPAVRERIIWGGLVPYNKVWATGAHMATTLESSTAISFGGHKVEPGKYALFTIPGKEEWTIILNKTWRQHLTDLYDQKDDVVRITVKPELVTENQERLMFSFDQTGEKKALLIFRWEKIRIQIPMEAE